MRSLWFAAACALLVVLSTPSAEAQYAYPYPPPYGWAWPPMQHPDELLPPVPPAVPTSLTTTLAG